MGSATFVEQAAMVALVFSRLAGFVVASPFPGKWVPMKARAVLTLVLALPLSFSLKAPAAPLGLDLSLALPACADFILGMLMGAAFYLVLAAAQFMAGMVSQASWLSAPISMNPATGGQSQVLGQVATLLAVMLALGAGVHRVVIAYVLASLSIVPVGSEFSLVMAMPTIVDLAGRSFDVGMRLAVPVFAVSLAVQAALALIARVAPSLQIFNVGFAVLVMSGLLTFAAALPSISAGILQFTDLLPEVLDDILTSASQQ